MKNKPYIGIVLALLIVAMPAVLAGVNPKLQLVDYSLSANPARPGDSLNLELKIRNIDTDNCADRVSIQASATYPLSVQGGDTLYVSRMCYGDENNNVAFVIPVDTLATTGTFPLTITTLYEYRYAKFSEINTINVRVAGTPAFSASVLASNPTDLYPGDKATIQLQLMNTGTGRADHVKIQVSGPDGLEVKWAGADQELGSILPRSGTNVSLGVEAAKNLAPGTYPLTAVIQYAGEDQRPLSQEFSFDVPVKKKADFAGDTSQTVPLFAGDNRVVTIRLLNTGTDMAKNLKVRIIPYFPFSTDGTVRFVSQLGPGESANLDYQITTDKDATPGAQLLGYAVDFEDNQGRKFSDTFDVSLNVIQKSLMQNLVDAWPIILIALLVVGIIMLRRRSKKPPSKK